MAARRSSSASEGRGAEDRLADQDGAEQVPVRSVQAGTKSAVPGMPGVVAVADGSSGTSRAPGAVRTSPTRASRVEPAPRRSKRGSSADHTQQSSVLRRAGGAHRLAAVDDP